MNRKQVNRAVKNSLRDCKENVHYDLLKSEPGKRKKKIRGIKIDKWELSVDSWGLAIQSTGCNCICWLNTEWRENDTFYLENKNMNLFIWIKQFIKIFVKSYGENCFIITECCYLLTFRKIFMYVARGLTFLKLCDSGKFKLNISFTTRTILDYFTNCHG